jgi:signal transduction histidine kinase/ActR/RegA family two-component response regulator
LNQDLSILVLAPTGRDGPLICEMLGRRGFACRSYRSVNELCRGIRAGVGAVILAEEALAGGGMKHLNTVVEAQPPWSDIGLVLLTSNGNRVQAALQAMLRDRVARSTILMERPVRLVSLASTVGSLLQSRRRQYEIRDYLEERLRGEARLRETQKLESLGVLAGGIAHDFNNLLTGVLGNASLALDDVMPGSHLASRLEDVVKATERAADLTRQLLAYAGKGRFVVQELDLSHQVREITALLQASIPRTVQLRSELAEGLPCIEADSAQIQQVIMNLVINGAEAIPENRTGSVLIATGVQDVDAAYIRTTLPDTEIAEGRYVTLEVHDTGVGISPDQVRQIFDPFFTTKFTGRGLGLAAVKGIVRGHKGAIKVYSTPGRGTGFKLLFPASRHEARNTASAAGEQPLLTGSGTVLVIDDEEIVRCTAQAALERFGYKVLLADDGLQGVERFRELACEIDLVLLDMTMPAMSGEDTFRELRLIRPEVKVILSSGYNEVEAIRRFTGKGLAGFVQKPYTSARLAEAVKSALGRTQRED